MKAMHPLRQRPLKGNGFTLLELVLAVTVAAVLAALLFAGLKGVRETSKNVRCINNLRMLGGAFGAYIADFKGMVPPRNLGYLRAAGEDKEPTGMRVWSSRFVNLGYIETLDLFYCPSFFPRNSKEARKPIGGDSGAEIYGLRTWVVPGQTAWTGNNNREEHKPFSAITHPADFFLLVDTVWVHPTWRSQGYGISPDIPKEQMIHLRHAGKANALFADGHVEAKPGEYFEDLGKPDRQRAYNAGREMKFGVTKEMKFD